LRLFFGIIIGIALTVGAARIADAFAPAPGADGAAKTMVNWDVVDRNLHGIGSWLQEGWTHLTGH
jgi:hypothetical protein